MSASLYRSFMDFDWQALLVQAKQTPRLRAHFNLHQSYSEPIQKTLICILKDSYIPPHFHRHEHQKELFVILKGQVKVLFFKPDGLVREVLLVDQGGMVEIPPFSIHTVICLSDYANILEVKQGPFFENDCKEFLDWSIPENTCESAYYCEWMMSAKVGESFK